MQAPSALLKVVNLPSQTLAYTNAVFISPADAALIRPTHNDTAFVTINDELVYEIRSETSLERGSIGLNALQRSALRVSLSDNCQIKSLVIPPKSNFNLAFLQIEVSLLKTIRYNLEEDALIDFVQRRMPDQLWSKGQVFVTDFQGAGVKLTVQSVEIVDLGKSEPISLVRFGVILPGTTAISFETSKKDQLLNLTKSKAQSRNNILRPSFKFSDMGIGGLDDEFGQIFRRAFASRTFPPDVVEKLGISHVRGMLLHGPPGTGKTLIARQIGKMLNGREPKVVNGPEILNKFVGQSEENIRKLFEDAEADYAQNKEHADLHIIIFDEIDAICKQRGTAGGGTGVHDTVVNQLLSKIDGVNSLNNILVIGMTNRKDMIDEALLRPGRLEVHVEIGLPDENGRHDILMIHTKAMRESGCLHNDVNIRSLAQQTKNFSGAELAGLVKSAVSFALYGNIDIKAGDKVDVKSVSDILVRMQHFEQALLEIIPAFGVSGEDLKLCLRNGFIEYGQIFKKFMDKCLMFVRHIKESDDTPLVSVLLHGPPGCGKTAIAAQLAIQSDVPFVKLVAPNDYLGLSENEKVSKLMKVFNDAYKSTASIIILDSIERLLEYTPVGPRFSNTVLQALLVKLTHPPPNAKRRLMIIGTTNNYSAIQSMEFGKVFKAIYEVPQVQNADEVKRIIADMSASVDGSEIDSITGFISYPIGIQQLLMVLQLAIRFGDGQLSQQNFSAALQNFNLDSLSHMADLHADYDFKL